MSTGGDLHSGAPRLRPTDARGRVVDDGIDAVEAFSRGQAIDRSWMGWGALRVLSRQRWAPGAARDEGRTANMERLLLVLSGGLDADCGAVGRHRVAAGGALWIGAGHGIEVRLANASAGEPLELLELWLQPDQVNAPPAVAVRDAGGIVDAVSGAGAPAGWTRVAAGAGTDDVSGTRAAAADPRRPLPLRQRAQVRAAGLAAGARLDIPAGQGGRFWLEVLAGGCTVAGRDGGAWRLADGDGLAWTAGDPDAPAGVVATDDGTARLLLVALPD